MPAHAHPIPLSSLSLFPATPEQVLEEVKRTGVQWGGTDKGTPVEAWLSLVESSGQLETASKGRHQIWVLAPRDDPQTTHFLCAVDTFQRRISIVRKSDDGSVQMEDSIGFSIMAVLTPPENQGHGYAKHMMRLLHWIIAPKHLLPDESLWPTNAWGSPPEKYLERGMGQGVVSALYSGIGPKYYAGTGPLPDAPGWIAHGTQSFVWELKNFKHKDPPNQQHEESKWKFLTLDEVNSPQFWETESLRMKEDLPALIKPGEIGFTYFPDRGVENFMRHLHVFFLPHWMEGSEKPFDVWGITDSKHDPSFATWTMFFQSHTKSLAIMINRLRATDSSVFEDMMTRIVDKLKEYGERIGKIEVWNLEERWIFSAEKLGGMFVDRQDRPQSIKWYGKEDPSRVHWLFNEHFASC